MVFCPIISDSILSHFILSHLILSYLTDVAEQNVNNETQIRHHVTSMPARHACTQRSHVDHHMRTQRQTYKQTKKYTGSQI